MKRKYSHQPCYVLFDHFGRIQGAHFRRLTLAIYAHQELFGLERIRRFYESDKMHGLDEAMQCKKLERELKGPGWVIEEAKVTHAYRLP